MTSAEQAAAQFVAAIRTIAEKPQNLDNLESYLSRHFPAWLSKYASTPEDMAAEMNRVCGNGNLTGAFYLSRC